LLQPATYFFFRSQILGQTQLLVNEIKTSSNKNFQGKWPVAKKKLYQFGSRKIVLLWMILGIRKIAHLLSVKFKQTNSTYVDAHGAQK